MRHMRSYSLPAGKESLKKITQAQTSNENKTRTNPKWLVNYCAFTFTLWGFPYFSFLLSSFFICFKGWQNKQCWKIKFMWFLLTLNGQASLFHKKTQKTNLIFNLLEVQLIFVDLFPLFAKYRRIQYYFLEIFKTFFFLFIFLTIAQEDHSMPGL